MAGTRKRNSVLAGAAVAAMVTTAAMGATPAQASSSFSWVNKKSGQCMGVSGGSTANGAAVIQFTCNGNSDQFWYYGNSRTGADGSTYWEIRNVKSGRCLAAGNNGSAANGTPFVLWDCNGAPDQFFRFEANGNFWWIYDMRSDKCVSVLNGSTQRSTPVVQWDCNGNDDQLWQ
jgi:hypothetical protein